MRNAWKVEARASRWLAILCLLLLFGPDLPAASFTVTLDRPAITVGENALLTLRYEGGEPQSPPALPSLPGLRIISQGTSSQFQISNGTFSRSVAHNFALVPSAPGEYVIPALTVNIGGSSYTSQPVKLIVSKPGSSAGESGSNPLAFLKLQPSKSQVFVGEVFTVELQAFFHEGIANAESLLQSFERFEGNPLKAEGIGVLKTSHLQRRRIQAAGSSYSVATVIASVVAIKPGPLTLNSIDANLSLHLPAGQRRRDPFFDVFGFGGGLQARQVVLSADPVKLEATRLPDGAPPDFNGAVGQFTVSRTASPTNVSAGDPITLKVEVTGRGAIENLQIPEQEAWQDFKMYPSTSKVETSDPLGVQGSKLFERVVSPETASAGVIPAFTFSYFDPDAKSYRTVTQPAIPITVKPSGPAPVPQVSAYTGQEETPEGREIVHIKLRPGGLNASPVLLINRSWFLLAQLVPVAALVAVIVYRRKQDSLARNPHLVRRRKTDQLVKAQLAVLEEQSMSGDSEAVYAGAFRLIQERLGERLGLPSSAITEAVVQEHLVKRQVPEPVLQNLEEIFQQCNQARYAPLKAPGELKDLVNKLAQTLNDLEAALP